MLNVLVFHARSSTDDIAAVTKAIVSGASELERANGLFRGLPGLFEPLRSEGAAALEFRGVALHRGAVEPVGIEDDRQGIAGKRPGREDVVDGVVVARLAVPVHQRLSSVGAFTPKFLQHRPVNASTAGRIRFRHRSGDH